MKGAESVYALALEAARSGRPASPTLIEAAGARRSRRPRGRLCAGPADARRSAIPTRRICTSPAPASPISARPRRATPCTRSSPTTEEKLTNSMKMFRMGLEGGKPAERRDRRAAGMVLQGQRHHGGGARRSRWSRRPSRIDAGEEPEIAGIYVIGDDGTPFRVGFALSNEFSDHVTERVNYLYLAHSKLRNASFGPEILVGALPADIRGTSRIRRGGTTLWEKPFLSGEANMSHTIANLEHHHFKYAAVPPAGRRPCPHVRHRDAVLRRRRQDRSRATCSRSRRRISACRCAIRWRSPSRRLSRRSGAIGGSAGGARPGKGRRWGRRFRSSSTVRDYVLWVRSGDGYTVRVMHSEKSGASYDFERKQSHSTNHVESFWNLFSVGPLDTHSRVGEVHGPLILPSSLSVEPPRDDRTRCSIRLWLVFDDFGGGPIRPASSLGRCPATYMSRMK